MTGTTSSLVVIGAYLVAGIVVAALLARQGQAPGTALAAVVVWPFLLPTLAARPATSPPRQGPCAGRIDRVFDALLQTLEDPASDEVPWASQALALRDALHLADARIAFVDRVLADADPQDEGGTAGSLRAARAHAAEEIESVLVAVSQLRLQVGLLALAGDALPVAAQLDALMGRATALLEVSEASYEQTSA